MADDQRVLRLAQLNDLHNQLVNTPQEHFCPALRWAIDEVVSLERKLDRLDRNISRMLDHEYDTGMREGVLADRRERSRG